MGLAVHRKNDLEAWSPFRELDDLHERFEHLLESAFGEFPTAIGTWSPAVDIEETDDSYVIEAELPGVKSGDVDIELVDNQLSIHGEIKEHERSGVLRRQTRRTGRFDYRVSLPSRVDEDKVQASMDDGVLRVELTKSEPKHGRKIEISSG